MYVSSETSPGVTKTSPGVTKTSPGDTKSQLVITITGLEKWRLFSVHSCMGTPRDQQCTYAPLPFPLCIPKFCTKPQSVYVYVKCWTYHILMLQLKGLFPPIHRVPPTPAIVWVQPFGSLASGSQHACALEFCTHLPSYVQTSWPSAVSECLSSFVNILLESWNSLLIIQSCEWHQVLAM